jgi:mycothiol synthase
MFFTVRVYRGDADLEKLVVLLNTVSKFDGEEQIYTLESLREEMNDPILDATNSCFIAETDQSQFIGDTVIVLRSSSAGTPFASIFYEIHPDWRTPETGVLESLIKRAEARVIQRRSELLENTGLLITLQVAPEQTGFIALFEQLGYAFERTYYTMIFSPLDNLVIPEIPEGITIRNYRSGEDDERFLNARNQIWRDHHLGSERTLESWQHYVTTRNFRPELNLIAEDKEGNIAGICWCAIDFEQIEAGGINEGWVNNLGVQRQFRKQGLGASLLMRGVAAMAKMGVERVMLGVDAASPTGAVGLYERSGFRVHKKRFMYVKRFF